MRKSRLFPNLFLLLAALLTPVRSEEPTASPDASVAEKNQEEEENPDTPASPDGKFAFVVDYDSDVRAIDLIDKASKKVLQRIDEEDISSTYWHVLWADDSSRFALMTRVGHPNQGVDVYFRNGNKFRKVKLPKLPNADIPTKMRHGKSYPHFAGNNWQEAESWDKDGSLNVTVTTTIDGGDGGSLTATRDLKLSFDKSGKAKIVKNTIKYETGEDE